LLKGRLKRNDPDCSDIAKTLRIDTAPQNQACNATEVSFSLLLGAFLKGSFFGGTMTFSVSVTDASGSNSQYIGSIAASVLAAAANWQSYLVQSNGSIDISVVITPTPFGTADGTSASSGFIGKDTGLSLFQAGAAYEIETGTDPNGGAPDVLIRVDPTYLQTQLWFDLTPASFENDIPPFRIDALSVFEHEIGHAGL
jgi:hypothetical protein